MDKAPQRVANPRIKKRKKNYLDFNHSTFEIFARVITDRVDVRSGMESQTELVRMGQLPVNGAFGEEIRSHSYDLFRSLLQNVSKSDAKGKERRRSHNRRQDRKVE